MNNFFINFFMISLIVVSNFFLGLLVFLKNKKDLKNIYFFLFALGVIAWNVCAFTSEYAVTYDNRLILSKLSYLFTLVAFYFAVNFMYRFLAIKNTKKMEIINTSIMIIVSIILLLTNKIITSITVTGDSFNINYGNLWIIFLVSIFYFVSQYTIFPIVRYKKAKGINRTQIKYLFAGFAIFISLNILFNVVFKLIFNTDKFYIYGNYSVIILIFLTSLAIIKHRLMDIKMVVARSVAYVILLITLALIYAGTVLGLEKVFFPAASNNFDLGQGALRTIVSVVMVFLFQPIKTWITKATDKVFFKNQYDPQMVLDEVSHIVSSTIVLVEMLYKVNDSLIKNLKLSRSAFVLFKNNDDPYMSQAIGYKGWPSIDVPDFIKMANKGTLVYDELEENSLYKRLLRKYDASILVPVRAEGELIGIFLGGEKSSGDMFTHQDIQILEIMAPEVAIASENAKSYEEISRFNVTLRQEVKRATQRLKQKNEELRELDKAKDEFISMASHQLRTPLTAIKGYLSMLLEGDAGEIKVSQYDFINEAYSAAGRMVGLINDLLNVSRMETGRFFLEPKEVNIERMVGEEVKQLQNHAREKGLYLKIETKGKVPTIWADETKIRQVVMNFIDNAIYYTTKGGVTVNLRKEKDDFVFEVEDTGIGVPKEQAHHLFEKFFRADNARQTRPDGTGLGIYLAKRVVEDHGGKIIFKTVEGKGSTFGFRFPLKVRATQRAMSAPAPKSAPALTSAAATFNEKSAGLEPPIATHPE